MLQVTFKYSSICVLYAKLKKVHDYKIFINLENHYTVKLSIKSIVFGYTFLIESKLANFT